MYSFLVIALIMSVSGSLTAQDSVRIAVKGMYVNDHIILRWAPQDIDSWKYGNAHGYRVERKTLRSNGAQLSISAFEASLVVLSANLTALPEQQWESLADTSNLAGIAAGAIYGDSLDLLPPSGGGLMEIYNKSREIESRFGFSLFAADQDLTVAKAMGLAFVDTSVQSNKEYVYFVKALGNAVSLNGFASVETNAAAALNAPTGLVAAPADKAVILQWNKDDASFSSFQVERAIGVAGNFTTLNQNPLLFAASEEGSGEPATYIDSLADNTTIYVYRVRGKTPFGLWSPPSDTIQVKGVEGPLAFLMSVTNVTDSVVGQLTISWEFPQVMEAQMQGFNIYRSAEIDGVYEKINASILSVTDRVYTDVNPLAANYYVVHAADVNGHEYRSFPYLGQAKDITPPVQPVITGGSCNEAGVVTLTWAKNPDPDILGYRVYMSNALDGDYAQLTGTWLNDTIYKFQAETNTLTEAMHFRIKALDQRQNQSPMSAPLSLMRPDVYPPSPPVISKVNALTTGVQFEWVLSSSTDVVAYALERQELGIPAWEQVLTFDANHLLTSFQDTTAAPRKRYQYRLVAIDDADLKSSSKIVKTRPVDNGMRHAIQNFAGQLLQNPKTVMLQWEYEDDADLIGFEVFRAINNVNKQRSYDFLKIPPDAPNGAVSNTATAVLNGNTWQCVFTDKDVKFALHQMNSFVVFPNPNANPNLAVPPPQPPAGNATTTTVMVQNPNNLAGQQLNQPIILYYWVMAKYADGAYSPVAGHVTINFQ